MQTIESNIDLSASQEISTIQSLKAIFYGQEVAPEERDLHENRTFERIIEGINGKGYVYSNGYKSYLAFADGTAVSEYLKNINPHTINFAGPITLEQATAAGLPYDETNSPKVTLLQYLVHYCSKNPQKIETLSLPSICSTLVAKGAHFNMDLCKSASGIGIDLTKLWASVHHIILGEASIEEILSRQKTIDMTSAILYRCYSIQPIKAIYPEALYNQYTPVFIKAVSERLAAAEAQLRENELKSSAVLSADLTRSTIIQDASITESTRQLTTEISMLKYALSASEIKVTADTLLAAEEALANLLTTKEALSFEIDKIKIRIAQSNKEIESDEKLAERKKGHLETKKLDFKLKWAEAKELSVEKQMEVTQETEEIAANQKHYNVLLEQFAQKKKTLEASNLALRLETEKLEQLNKLILVADTEARALACKYNKCLEAQPEVNPMALEVIEKVRSDECERAPGALMKFLSQNTIPTDQKGVILFDAIVCCKWGAVTPLLAAGIKIDGLRHNQETIMGCIARKYESNTPQVVLLAFAHISEEALQCITSEGVKSYSTQFFPGSLAFKHLNDNKKPEEVSNSK